MRNSQSGYDTNIKYTEKLNWTNIKQAQRN